MGDWGGAPPGWVPPEERKEREAAAEAAERMAERRAAEDARSEAVAGAIRDGFGMVAAAIMSASEHPASFALERFDTIWQGLLRGPGDDYSEGDGDDEVRAKFGEGGFASPDFLDYPRPVADAEVDDLLSDDTDLGDDPDGDASVDPRDT